MDEILTIVLDPDVGDEQIGVLLRERVGMDRLRAAWAAHDERLARDHGHLAMLDASMSYRRQFAPDVLKAVRFADGPGTGALLAAGSILTGLNATGTRKVPAGAPVGFVPARHAGYLAASAEAGTSPGTGTTGSCAYCWRYATGCVPATSTCRGRAGTPTRRRFCSPGAVEPQRVECCHLVGKPTAAGEARRRPTTSCTPPLQLGLVLVHDLQPAPTRRGP